MSSLKLLEPFKLGDIELRNRIVMAPMTRSRAFIDNIPNEMAKTYYRQRSTAGLIISEGAQISEEGIGYLWTPGIYTQEQIDEWTKITDEVHKNNGRIFLQLWHCGRISHPELHNGRKPLAPSSITPKGRIYTSTGWQEFTEPQEMSFLDIKRTLKDFGTAAYNAKICNFDGVELHGAFGYLIEQFICSNTNKRTDVYGGSIENRLRFVYEALEEIINVWGENKVGIKLSPSNIANDILHENPVGIYSILIEKLNSFKLAYIHLLEPQSDLKELPDYLQNVAAYFRKIYNGTIISNGNHNKESGEKMLNENIADLISYGMYYISNPDLPSRFENNYPLVMPNRKTYYGGGAEGYIDYPEYQIEI